MVVKPPLPVQAIRRLVVFVAYILLSVGEASATLECTVECLAQSTPRWKESYLEAISGGWVMYWQRLPVFLPVVCFRWTWLKERPWRSRNDLTRRDGEGNRIPIPCKDHIGFVVETVRIEMSTGLLLLWTWLLIENNDAIVFVFLLLSPKMIHIRYWMHLCFHIKILGKVAKKYSIYALCWYRAKIRLWQGNHLRHRRTQRHVCDSNGKRRNNSTYCTETPGLSVFHWYELDSVSSTQSARWGFHRESRLMELWHKTTYQTLPSTSWTARNA